MNAIEFQLWKNHERADEDEMTRNIEMAQESLTARQAFVMLMDRVFGEFLPDLLAGPVEPVAGQWKKWKVPIKFNGVSGRIEGEDGFNRLYVWFPKNYTYMSLKNDVMSPEQIADWLFRATK